MSLQPFVALGVSEQNIYLFILSNVWLNVNHFIHSAFPHKLSLYSIVCLQRKHYIMSLGNRIFNISNTSTEIDNNLIPQFVFVTKLSFRFLSFSFSQFNQIQDIVRTKRCSIQYTVTGSAALLYEPCHEKTCFCHMRTTKAQISLHIRAVWSAPLWFTS